MDPSTTAQKVLDAHDARGRAATAAWEGAAWRWPGEGRSWQIDCRRLRGGAVGGRCGDGAGEGVGGATRWTEVGR